MATELSKRSQYMVRKGALWLERSSWFEHWREISDNLLPRSGRFFATDRNKGQKRHNKIINSTGTRSLRILAAGMMAGMTSPARPWFRLETPDSDLMEVTAVKLWLEAVTKKMRDIFAGSNTYRALHSLYEELGAFGTGADFILPNFKHVVHHTPLTAGEYAIAVDHEGNVNTIVREFDMTVANMIDQFGPTNVSQAVKRLYDTGKSMDSWVPVIHLIEPRTLRDASKRDNLNMPFKSVYFEAAGQEDKFLRESGFKRFPGLCPRWGASGGDIYGNSPGMEALGDVKQLQHDELRKAQAIDYMTKPPLAFPTGMKEMEIDTLPGGAAFYDGAVGSGKIEPMWEPTLNISHLDQSIMRVENRIGQTFYADLFLMLAQDTRSNITAREIAERHEEKLLMLGPVLERLHNEFLQPLIDVTFDEMVLAGIVPPPPDELHGVPLKVEFVSMLAQAQRAIGVQSVDRLIGTVGSIAIMQANAGVAVTALDKLNVDQTIDAYSEMLGVDPNLIVADDQVMIVRDNRAKQQAEAQRMAQAEQASAVAKNLAQAPTNEDNALAGVMGKFSGYSVPGTL